MFNAARYIIDEAVRRCDSWVEMMRDAWTEFECMVKTALNISMREQKSFESHRVDWKTKLIQPTAKLQLWERNEIEQALYNHPNQSPRTSFFPTMKPFPQQSSSPSLRYPPLEGGWGWACVIGCALMNFISAGMGKSFGVIMVTIINKFHCTSSQVSFDFVHLDF